MKKKMQNASLASPRGAMSGGADGFVWRLIGWRGALHLLMQGAEVSEAPCPFLYSHCPFTLLSLCFCPSSSSSSSHAPPSTFLETTTSAFLYRRLSNTRIKPSSSQTGKKTCGLHVKCSRGHASWSRPHMCVWQRILIIHWSFLIIVPIWRSDCLCDRVLNFHQFHGDTFKSLLDLYSYSMLHQFGQNTFTC